MPNLPHPCFALYHVSELCQISVSWQTQSHSLGGSVFRTIHPILGTRDLEKALAFYVDRLGFQLAFRDGSVPTNYAGLRRDTAVSDDGIIHLKQLPKLMFVRVKEGTAITPAGIAELERALPGCKCN